LLKRTKTILEEILSKRY